MDGTVDVDYDDGDLEERVKPEFVLAALGTTDGKARARNRCHP